MFRYKGDQRQLTNVFCALRYIQLAQECFRTHPHPLTARAFMDRFGGKIIFLHAYFRGYFPLVIIVKLSVCFTRGAYLGKSLSVWIVINHLARDASGRVYVTNYPRAIQWGFNVVISTYLYCGIILYGVSSNYLYKSFYCFVSCRYLLPY